jgi:hypothetical protein
MSDNLFFWSGRLLDLGANLSVWREKGGNQPDFGLILVKWNV